MEPSPRRPAPISRKRLPKLLLAAGGTLSLGLGLAGIFLPVLPTTPFLLLTAWCYARSSPRLHRKLLQNRYLGAYILKFQKEKALPLRVKIISCTLVWLSLLWCTFFAPGIPIWIRPVFPVTAWLITRHICSFATLPNKQTRHWPANPLPPTAPAESKHPPQKQTKKQPRGKKPQG